MKLNRNFRLMIIILKIMIACACIQTVIFIPPFLIHYLNYRMGLLFLVFFPFYTIVLYFLKNYKSAKYKKLFFIYFVLIIIICFLFLALIYQMKLECSVTITFLIISHVISLFSALLTNFIFSNARLLYALYIINHEKLPNETQEESLGCFIWLLLFILSLLFLCFANMMMILN